MLESELELRHRRNANIFTYDERARSMTLSAACASELRLPRSRTTGKERDSESGNDYFEARYYSSSMGRFMSPDWAAKEDPVPYATFDDPQSLNLYSYVKNNPLSHADADGHCCDWNSIIIGSTTALGGMAGAVGGAAAGATVGTFVVPGVGTISGGAALGTLGAATGATFGNAVGNAIVNVLNSSNSSSQPATAGPPSAIPDDANVVRGGSGGPGGANSPEGIAAGTGTHPSGVTGFSVETAPGKSVGELGKGVPNGQVGCCKAGEIRAAGGEVQPTSGRSPNHGTVSGLSPQAASKLLTPTIPNPGKVKPQ